jgi:signal transduction histidine kinase
LIRNNLIYGVIAVISILMVANILFTSYNNKIITENRSTQFNVQQIQDAYDQVGKSVIRSIDIGLRGFAIAKDSQFSAPLDNALIAKDSIYSRAETPLKALGYQSDFLEAFKDSLDAYAIYGWQMKKLLMEGKDEEFAAIFMEDKGAHLWWMYEQLEMDIRRFLTNVSRTANAGYDAAMFRNQILQIVLFIVCFPTLLYTAFYTVRNFKLFELLKKAEEDKNRILREQNEILEQKVKERTMEITEQNEKILSQTEALSIQNKQLYEAQKTIELQHREIQTMNTQLKTDVSIRTQELRQANKHLLEQNNQLEQFAFIAAHNLRAPLARILGLANLIKVSQSEDDRVLVMDKIVSSTHDLDHVVGDLNVILNIKKHTSNLADVDLEGVLERVKRTLEQEIQNTHAVVTSDFHEASKVYAVAPYVESILYNLISNAIKYRDPLRIPFIVIQTTIEQDDICLSVTDNGLGIDLSRFRQNLFALYKRFHLHVEGRGLGLYLVKTQIESMGGTIGVKSTPNEGTTFEVRFRHFLN